MGQIKNLDNTLKEYADKFEAALSQKEPSPTTNAKEEKANDSNIKEQMQSIREKLQAKYSKEEIQAQIQTAGRIEMLKQIGNIKKSAKGQTFFEQGDDGDCMYIILHGIVDIYINKLGKNHKVARLKEKDFFGEMSLLEKMPRSGTAVSYTDALVLEIREENFMKFIQYEPEISFNLMKALSSRIRELNQKIKE